MKKTERYKLIKEALNNGGFNFVVLNKSGDRWNHVRVKGFGDIWPGTGTYRIGDKYYKKDFNGLYQRLTGKVANVNKSNNKTEIDKLWQVINELLKRVEGLEIDVHSPASRSNQ